MLFLSAFVSTLALKTDLVLIPDGDLVDRILGIRRRFVKGFVPEKNVWQPLPTSTMLES